MNVSNLLNINIFLITDYHLKFTIFMLFRFQYSPFQYKNNLKYLVFELEDNLLMMNGTSKNVGITAC